MISNRCHIDKRGHGRQAALSEAEKVAVYCGLDTKDALRLRLLAEELTGMMQGIVGDYYADFWIQEEDGLFTLLLAADAEMDYAARERLISIASSGKNEAARGIMGKLAVLFETYVLGGTNGSIFAPLPVYFYPVGMESPAFWSMQTYRNELVQNKEAYPAEWDELESSIVANLADNITVGLRASRVEIQVSKRF